MHSAINYSAVNSSFLLKNKRIVSAWLQKIISQEGKKRGDIAFIFCDDDYLYKINKKFLKHSTLTDIVTFNYNEDDFISGDIFISLDRVRENASLFHKTFDDELYRVMCHGILHLTGYNDSTNSEKADMRAKEENSLLLLKEMKKRST